MTANGMIRRCTACAAGLAGLLLAEAARAAPVRATTGAVDVRAFIEQAGNPADHTEAIREAFAEAARTRALSVVFPPGYYTITNAIHVGAVEITGVGNATIQQRDPSRDIFVQEAAWRVSITGLRFRGGRDQIVLGTRNVDQSIVDIARCQFFNAAGVAVRTLKRSNSTLFKVKDCVFTDCEQAVVNHCDLCVIQDCWMSTSTNMRDRAVVENYGILHVENLLGVPRPRRGEGLNLAWTVPATGGRRVSSNQRWVDNHGGVHLDKCRFGGEGGGFSAVWNFTARGQVTIENSYIYNAQSAAIHLVEVPALITVRNNTGLEDSFLFRVDERLDLAAGLGRRRPRIRIDVGQYPLDEAQLNGWAGGGIYGGLPEELYPYIEGEIRMPHAPAKGVWRKGQFVKHAACHSPDMPRGWLCTASGNPGTWAPVRYAVEPAPSAAFTP